MAVSKKDFIDYMAANGCKTKKSCKEYLDLMLDTFYLLPEEGEAIRFTGIMKAETKVTPERPGRNPQTGEVYMTVKNERGQEARKYFIACEQGLKVAAQKLPEKNILQDFQMNISKEILKLDLELVENSTLLIY